MTAATRSPASRDWREIASLGEQLVSATSLTAQHKRIVSMASRMMGGRAAVWLDESLFRLPSWEGKRLFPAQPPLHAMRRALASGKVYAKGIPRNKAGEALAAIPLEDQGVSLGVLQVTRSRGPDFKKEELELLESLASVIAVGLYASHRVEVERFRLGQLNLVREVSAQVANVLDLDELARRVTELIQKTFNYYYVAIFTLRPDSQALRFRASASAPRKGRKKASIALEVRMGEGLIGEAASSGQRVASANVRTDERYRFIDSLPETRSEVALPLKIEERILGVLDVQSDRPDAFHPNDLLILGALADNIARAVDSARLYGNLNRRANQMTLVAEVSRSVTSTLDLRSLMREAAALIHDRFGYPYVHLFTVHPNRRVIAYEAGSGRRSEALEGYSIPLDEPQGIIPWVARHGETVLANDVMQDARYRPSSLPPRNTRSELCVPLLFNARVVGVLDIQSDRLNGFTEDDRVMFEAVADTIAAALRNADLYRSEQWRRQVADSLREVAGLLSANVGVDQVLDTILTELERNLPVDISSIWLLGDGDLYLAATHGGDAAEIERARLGIPHGSLALTTALLSEEPVIRKAGDPIWPLGQAAGFDSNYSSLAAPLRVGEQPVGVIALAHGTPGRYGHEAQAMTTTFASYAAVAIENARLYDAAQEQAYASAALLQVAQAVVSLNELDEILGTIVRVMPILVGVERVAIYLWDAAAELFQPAYEYGMPEGEFAGREFGAGKFPLLDQAREQNQVLTCILKPKDSPEKWPRLKPGEADESSLRDAGRLLVSVPLAIKNDHYGVMLVEEAAGGRRFRARRLEIVSGIAQQAALAIQNDRLQEEMVVRERLETEVQLARQIQQTFIPDKLPKHADWELAARWKTARQVGGDFYDVFELPDQRLGLFIADVADKGIPAALFMALTRTLVRAAIIETPSPAEALRRVNDLLLPDTRQGMFVTAVYAVLDRRTGDLTYANAGHNPPLYVCSDGRVEKLTRTGIALGVVETGMMTQSAIRLMPGESLLMYTDGVTETFSPEGELFGEGRLIDTIGSAKGGSVDELLDQVQARLDQFSGPLPASDDLTMLAVRRLSA